MSSTPARRRNPARRYFAAAGTVAAVGVTFVAWTGLSGVANAESLRVGYAKVSDWGTGYTAEYTLTNTGGAAVHGWNLAFDLPVGASIGSLWNGRFSVSGRQVTVRPQSWNADLGGGQSAVVGFVVDEARGAGSPSHCTIDGTACKGGPAPSPSASGRPSGTPGPGKTGKPTPKPTRTKPTPTPSSTAPMPPSGGGNAAFAPYVDVGIYPPFNLTDAMSKSGAKQFNLAFVVDGGGCTPKWGGSEDLTANAVAAQIGALRKAGGDVRVSFGGANGTELALACTDVGSLTAAYQKVIDTFALTKIDFDVEGAAVTNAAANDRRSQAILRLAQRTPGLKVSYTLPVLPQGLTQDGLNVLKNAASRKVPVDAVNVMAMDFGDSAAPSPAGKMGDYAIDAATATQGQVKGVFGLSDSAAWHHVAVTPMLGVNDTSDEIFTVADARKLAAFARGKGLAWTSMWAATRDRQCAGGAKTYADATCSSILQSPFDFSKAFAG